MEKIKFDTTNHIHYETYRDKDIRDLFIELKEVIINAYDKLNYSTYDMNVYYKRSSDKKSVLAIKTEIGDNSDAENFMFNYCVSDNYNGKAKVKISVYSQSKSSLKSMLLNNLLSTHLEYFFINIENTLLSKGKEDLDLGIIIPLDSTIVKVKPYIKTKK